MFWVQRSEQSPHKHLVIWGFNNAHPCLVFILHDFCWTKKRWVERKLGSKIPVVLQLVSTWYLCLFFFVQNVAVGSPSLSRMALSLGNRLPSLQQLPGNRFECLEVKRGGFTYVQEGNWWKLCSVSQAWRWNSFTSEGFLGALSYTNTNLLVVICGWLDVWLCCMR